jgi:hypothetical protein
MTLPLRFSDAADEARRRAQEFQRLPPDQRWRDIAALMSFGWRMVRSSPHCVTTERLMEEQELRWQQIQRELFARHGR